MFLLVAILALFTVILVVLFTSWCAMLPQIPQILARPEVVPFSTVKSPRRNSMFNDLESVSSNSCSKSTDYYNHPKYSLNSICSIENKKAYSPETNVASKDDYLHPKYSLPPIKIDIASILLVEKELLRTPVHLHRPKQKSSLDDSNKHDKKPSRNKSLPSIV